MRARLLAVLGAVLMIVAAIAIRSRIDSGGSSGGDDSGSKGGGTAVVCDSDLDGACPSGATRTEPAATTSADLVGVHGEPPLAVWFTLGPWPQMVDATREVQSQPKLLPRPTAIANTPLVAVAKKGKLTCPPPGVTWKCIAETNSVTVSSPDPESSTGFLVQVAAITGLVGNTTYDIGDVRDNSAVMSTVTAFQARIADARSRGSRDLDSWISIFPGGSDVFLTTEAEANTLVLGSRVASQVDIIRPQSVVIAEATVGATSGHSFDSTAVRNALTKGGWSPGAAKAPTGLPSPDVLYALQDVVR